MTTGDLSDGPIVVGTDGSANAADAVAWAATLAARRNRALRIVHAFTTIPGLRADAPPIADVNDAVTEEAGRVVAAAGDVAKAAAPDVRIETGVLNGDTAPALVAESRSASMVVLGATGRGGFTGMLTGSTAVAVTGHAECPVAVVRRRDDGTLAADDGPVLVGVDGSPLSECAIAVAFREASLRGVALVAVYAWRDVEYDGAYTRAPVQFAGGPHEQEQRELLAERLAGYRETYPDVEVERVVVLDRPRRQLLERSRTASLVVVGSRGRGGFRGLLLGSTSQALIQHAGCPVLVARNPRGR
ncbi:universal stress protein [Prauserella cavernicola]|uniref:Universal stress protein n=1 Tax=Prauserella cavernicola TaxID=2800127 RepID=A0A934V3M8_9PSEU|nr:universal stress protein [Prauserella cavernicola]MBK1783879.1 universal stress protein [Prauserella cavernicola]